MANVDYKSIYKSKPSLYDKLVRAEDVDGNLLTELKTVLPIQDSTVVESGAGTGRLTRLLLEAGASSIIATELEPAMLDLARSSLNSYKEKIRFIFSDARKLPILDNTADIGIAGWVFGHFCEWMAESWKLEISLAIEELRRITKANGTIVIIETLGTGSETPAPSSCQREYYAWLEEEQGFLRREIRTDYLFDTVESAAIIAGEFFGKNLKDTISSRAWTRIPECTGIWLQRKEE